MSRAVSSGATMRPSIGRTGKTVAAVSVAVVIATALLVHVSQAKRPGGDEPAGGSQQLALAGAMNGLHVVGNTIRNADGQAVRLHGVNRSGTEYACSGGWGIFDGPADAAEVLAMRAWNINAVRVVLNESCWLGISGVPAEY